MFIAELDHPEFGRIDLSSLRTGIMAGSPCPIEVMKRVVDRMHMREVTIAYGMTETSPVSFQSATDDPLERRVSTVGRIHPHLEVKIVDLEGRVVPRGEPGELCTRGYSVMLGYWDDPEKSDEVIDAAGWMHTGDLASLDAEGYCNIVGRIKDMVIRGGENLYPREIEEFLFTHPKIQAVQVFGVADRKYGEELCAWITLRAGEAMTEEEVRAFCHGQIAHHEDSPLRRVRRGVPDDRHRQGAEVPHAPGDGGAARPRGGQDGLSAGALQPAAPAPRSKIRPVSQAGQSRSKNERAPSSNRRFGRVVTLNRSPSSRTTICSCRSAARSVRKRQASSGPPAVRGSDWPCGSRMARAPRLPPPARMKWSSAARTASDASAICRHCNARPASDGRPGRCHGRGGRR